MLSKQMGPPLYQLQCESRTSVTSTQELGHRRVEDLRFCGLLCWPGLGKFPGGSDDPVNCAVVTHCPPLRKFLSGAFTFRSHFEHKKPFLDLPLRSKKVFIVLLASRRRSLVLKTPLSSAARLSQGKHNRQDKSCHGKQPTSGLKMDVLVRQKERKLALLHLRMSSPAFRSTTS